MCIDENGVCKSCSEEFKDLPEYSVCPDINCPSNEEEKAEAAELWSKLGDIPVNTQEEIEEAFLEFEKGTHREEIWTWFEEKFNLSVADDLMYSK